MWATGNPPEQEAGGGGLVDAQHPKQCHDECRLHEVQISPDAPPDAVHVIRAREHQMVEEIFAVYGRIISVGIDGWIGVDLFARGGGSLEVRIEPLIRKEWIVRRYARNRVPEEDGQEQAEHAP
jgi:hypothetical protein